jgi:hypothetical protein
MAIMGTHDALVSAAGWAAVADIVVMSRDLLFLGIF